jgi:hypothetical protein
MLLIRVQWEARFGGKEGAHSLILFFLSLVFFVLLSLFFILFIFDEKLWEGLGVGLGGGAWAPPLDLPLSVTVMS